MMRKPSKIRSVVALAIALSVSGVLVSCGRSSNDSSPKTTATTTTKAKASPPSTAATTEPAGAAVVTAKRNDKLGTILADQAGMTLYTLTNNGKAVACSGPCLNAWPPLVAPAGTTSPTGASGITGLGVADGADGTKVVAADGLPLYHFVQDKDGEDAYGEGLKSFGGVWHVVKTTATPTATSDDSPTTTPTSEDTTTSSGY